MLKTLVISIILLSVPVITVFPEQESGDKVVTAEGENTTASQAGPTVQESIETAKSARREITQETKELEEDKKLIEEEKRRLEKSGKQSSVFFGEGRVVDESVLKQKKEALKRQEEAVKAREQAIREKVQAYEGVVATIESKLKILSKDDLNVVKVDEEIRDVNKRFESYKEEKAGLKDRLPILELEVKALENELSAHKVLLELRTENKEPVADVIGAKKRTLEATREQMAQIKERISFVDIQIDMSRDYLKALRDKRLEVLRTDLFTAKRFEIDNLNVGIPFFLLVVFILLAFFRKTLRDRITGKNDAFSRKLFARIMNFLIYGGAGAVLLYFALSVAGYNNLAVFAGKKVLVLGGVLLFMFIIHRFIARGAEYILVKREKSGRMEDGTQPREELVHGISVISGWVLFFAGVYYAASIAGFQSELVSMILTAVRKPFFSAGDLSVSLLVLFKAVIILWLFVVGAKILNRLLKENVYRRVHIEPSVQYTFSIIIKYIMIVIGFFMSMSIIGIKLGALTVFAGTIGVGIGFGLQEIAKNFISGLVMLVERPIKVGDYIEVGGLPGRVKAIKARSTIVDTFDNISVVVPNAEFISQRVVNWSYSDKLTRIKIPVGVAYGTDPEVVKKALIKAAKKSPRVLNTPPPYVWFEEFADSSLNFSLFVWTRDPQNRLSLKSDINYDINRIFKEQGIQIPFPQRDVHIIDTPRNEDKGGRGIK
jgi:small-conductance mechanosensitive channel